MAKNEKNKAVKSGNSRSENPDPVDIHVGTRVRLRRNLIGVSQEQLARALDLTFQQVQKYERGVNRMAASRLHQIAGALAVPITYFFDGLDSSLVHSLAGFAEEGQAPLTDGPGNEKSSVDTQRNDFMQGAETIKFVRAYQRVTDPTMRRRLYDLMRSMADAPVDDDSE